MDKIPYLQKDAEISLKFGTDFIEKLGSTYMYIITGKTEKDMEELQEKIKNKVPLEDWTLAASTLLTLLRAIYKQAEAQGDIELREVTSK